MRTEKGEDRERERAHSQEGACKQR